MKTFKALSVLLQQLLPRAVTAPVSVEALASARVQVSERSYAENRDIINLVKRVAKEEYGVRLDASGGVLRTSSHDAVVERFMSGVVSWGEIFVANQIDKDEFANTGPTNELAGEFVDVVDGEVRLVNSDEIREANVIISPGLGGGDGPRALRETHTDFRRIFSKPEERCITYAPLLEGTGFRNLRYFRGMLPYADSDSINEEESKNFYKKVLLPKFTDKKGKFLPPEECDKMILAGFSIGLRELESHVRYLQKKLRSNGYEEGEVQKYLERIAVVGIGSPLTWKENGTGLPNSVDFISIEDSGTKKPKTVLELYLDRRYYERGSVSKLVPATGTRSDTAVIMGPGIITHGKNVFGHRLTNYVDGILGNEDLMRLIGMYRDFLRPDLSYKDFQKSVAESFKDARKFLPREIEPEDVKALIECWRDYMLEEENVRSGNRAKKSHVAMVTARSGNVIEDNGRCPDLFKNPLQNSSKISAELSNIRLEVDRESRSVASPAKERTGGRG
jgi:hypothetical protein